MYALARLILFTTVIIIGISDAADFKEQANSPLQCYICVIEHNGDVDIQSDCSVLSPNVKTAQCAKSHGYDRCVYYRARCLSTGSVLLRRQCATRRMCEGQCLSSNHTDCQMKCCQGDLCNDGFFDVKEAGDDPDVQPAVTSEPTGRQKSSTTSPMKVEAVTTNTGIPETTVTTDSKSSVVTDVPTTFVTSDDPETTVATGDPQKTVSSIVSSIQVTPDGVVSSSETEEQLVGGPTVTPNTECKDYRNECAQHAAYPSYCQYNREFMLQYCQVSCRFCEPSGEKENVTTTTIAKQITTTDVPKTTAADHVPTATVTTDIPERQSVTTSFIEGQGGFVGGPSGCRDLRVQCQDFSVVDGYCNYHHGFMLKTCPRSCGFCDGGEATEAPESPTFPGRTTTKSNEPEVGVPEKPLIPLGNAEENDRTGCMDLRENCTYYAKVDGYCEYNKDFMLFHCPFSCGFCGITPSFGTGAFPHPAVFPTQSHRLSEKNFPEPPTSKEIRWIALQCSECRQGYKHCSSTCILLLNNGEYEPTDDETCLKLLGKPEKITRC